VGKTLDGVDMLWLDDVHLADMPRVGAKFARLGAGRAGVPESPYEEDEEEAPYDPVAYAMRNVFKVKIL
jgi:hypothetical protein